MKIFEKGDIRGDKWGFKERGRFEGGREVVRDLVGFELVVWLLGVRSLFFYRI